MSKSRVRRHDVVQPDDKTIKLIPLTKGRNAIVDTEDYERLNRYNWYVKPVKHRTKTPTYYAVRRPTTDKPIYMHREILQTKDEVDHVNHDGLDNRKSNLRICTHAQNTGNKRPFNKSGFKGVCPHYKRWVARIGDNRSKTFRYLGCFKTPEEAARAYDKAAKEMFGEFAHLNFPS